MTKQVRRRGIHIQGMAGSPAHGSPVGELCESACNDMDSRLGVI